MKLPILLTLLNSARRSVAHPDASGSTEQRDLINSLDQAIAEISSNDGLELEVVDIFESASCDGGDPHGDKIFFLEKARADKASKTLNGNYATTSINHRGVSDGAGRFLIVQYGGLVPLYGSRAFREDIRARALAKLTPEERQELGLKFVEPS